MTANSTVPSTAVHRTVPAPDPLTAAGAVVGLGCTFVGTYVETPWESGPGAWGVDFSGNGGWTTAAALVGFAVVALVLVAFAVDRARTVAPGSTARRALVLAVLGALTVAVFWTGLPPVLAGGAATLALDAHRRLGRLPVPAAAALALAVLTVGAAVYLAFAG
jgi:hypothetical protein